MMMSFRFRRMFYLLVVPLLLQRFERHRLQFLLTQVAGNKLRHPSSLAVHVAVVLLTRLQEMNVAA